MMADLAVGMLQSVAAEMADRPLSEEDAAIAHEPLIAPMLRDNDVSCRGAGCHRPLFRSSKAGRVDLALPADYGSAVFDRCWSECLARTAGPALPDSA